MSAIDNKRIAKNSVFLYIRTLILMLITLYTSRVVLNALGVSDFGVYSVVGGVVVLFTFINSALSGSTQRFLNVAMGSGISDRINEVFKSSVQIHIAIAVLVIILSETIGLFFVTNILNIPENSRVAAHWVFQFSVITTVVNILSAPYNAVIISHEKMAVFAYFSIVEGCLKLAVAIIITLIDSHRLIFYAALLCVVSIIIRVMYNIYCVRHFAECHWSDKALNRTLIREMSVFSGWSLCGTFGYIVNTQGMAFVINLFFGTVLNAALSIANQVNSAAYQMIYGFIQAMRPQIMKSYGAHKVEEMNSLVILGSKIAIILTSIFVIPVCLETEYLLRMWLKEIPQYTVSFVQIMLLLSLVNSPLLVITAAQEATGKIRIYQLVSIISSIVCLPISWILYRRGYDPSSGLIANLVLGVVSQIVRVVLVHKSTGLSFVVFSKDVVFRCGSCIIMSFLFGYILKNMSFLQTFYSEIVVMVFSTLLFCLATLYFGLSVNERAKVIEVIRCKIHFIR